MEGWIRTRNVGLLGPAKITLRNEDMTHRQHAQTTQLLGCVEHDWRETRRHLTVQANLDTRLNLVLGLDECIQKLVGVDDGFAVVCHETNKSGVPLVDNLGERGGARTHEDLTNAVVELLHAWK